MKLDDLKVRRGDPIEPFVKRLLTELPILLRYFTGRGVRFSRTPDGIIVTADVRSKSWNHPFRVSVSGNLATVGAGVVNNLVPQIKRVGIDGLDFSGKTVPLPSLKLTERPNSELRSWICVQVRVDMKSGTMSDADLDALTIVHARTLDQAAQEGGFPDSGSGLGLQPLAMLVWSQDRQTVAQVFQITHHNLQHRFVKDGGASLALRGRHFFWAI